MVSVYFEKNKCCSELDFLKLSFNNMQIILFISPDITLKPDYINVSSTRLSVNYITLTCFLITETFLS